MNSISMRQKSWGNGSTSGPWVKFDLSDEEDLNRLKNNNGKCYEVFLVEVDDNGQPIHGEKPKTIKIKGHFTTGDGGGGVYMEESATLDDVTPEEWNNAQKLMINNRPASNYASLLTKTPNFQKYLYALDEAQCDRALKKELMIASKSELDSDKQAFDRFVDIIKKYNSWATVPPVSVDQAVYMMGGSLDEDDLSLHSVS